MKKHLAWLLSLTVLQFPVFSQSYEWRKALGGYGASVVADGIGNVYATGSFEGTADFGLGNGTLNLTSAGESDVFVIKMNATGQIVWAKRMGDTTDDNGAAIALDGSGNIYVSGDVESYASDVFITKLDSDGNFLWTKTVGGQYNDYVYSMAVDAGGNVYTTGHFEGGGDFDPGSETSFLYCSGGYCMYVLKLDTDGNFIWATQNEGPAYAEGHSIRIDTKGEVCITGSFTDWSDFAPGADTYELTSAGETDIFLLKLDPSGAFVSATRYGSPGTDNGAAIAIGAGGELYLAGSFRGIADFDPGAGTYPLLTNGLSDAFVAKFDATGNIVWARNVGGSDNDLASDVGVDQSGGVYVAGRFQVVADFDPGAGEHKMLASAYTADNFLLKLDAPGNFVWSDQTDESSFHIMVDPSGTVYGVGSISVVKLDGLIMGAETSPGEAGVKIYPNPATGLLNVESSQPAATFRIVDQLGQEVMRGSLDGLQTTIDLAGLEPGLYLLALDHPRTKSVKVIKY
jgi:hypothetical protein